MIQTLLMGTYEVAMRLGISRQYVLQLLKENKMPDPVEKLNCGTIWLTRDIENWIAEGRRNGHR